MAVIDWLTMKPWELASLYAGALASIAAILGLVVIFSQTRLMERQTRLSIEQLRLSRRQDEILARRAELVLDVETTVIQHPGYEQSRCE
jgi:hypothetical protein